MSKAIRDIAKKRGRPKTTGLGKGVLVRLHNPMLGEIDAWRAAQDDEPPLPEAIRRLVALALTFTRTEEKIEANRAAHAVKPKRAK